MTNEEFLTVQIGCPFAIDIPGGIFRSGTIMHIAEEDGVRIGFLMLIETSTDDPSTVGKYLPLRKDMLVGNDNVAIAAVN